MFSFFFQTMLADNASPAEDGVMKFYDQLSHPSKSVLLDVVAESAEDASTGVVAGLEKRFKQKSARILTTSNTKSSSDPVSKGLDLEDSNETRKLLSCLAILSCGSKQVSSAFSDVFLGFLY